MWKPDSFEKTLMLGKIDAGGEGENRGWDGCMALLIWRTWVWVNSGSWWWAGGPGMLLSMGCQRGRHDWVTVLNWTGTNASLSSITRICHTDKIYLLWVVRI